MRHITIKIGEHLVFVRTGSDALIEGLSRMFDTPEARATGGAGIDLVVDAEYGYGEPSPDYEVDIESDDKSITYTRKDYRLVIDSAYRRATIAAYNNFSLKHGVMNLYSAFIVHHGWGLMMHSSCVVEEGKAYLFAGQSGAGKSTVAKLSAPRPLLSDEATLVKIDGGEATVYHSPFRSELQSSYDGGVCPLAGIHILVQSLQVERLPVTHSEGFAQLMDKVFFWAHDARDTGNVLRLLRDLVQAVPVYKLYFQKNDTFWEKIS